MTRPSLLILRPEPGASATARRAEQAGWRAVVAPMFVVKPLVWDAVDPAPYDAVMVTSANAMRHGGAGLAALTGLPLYAVGQASAAAACEAGFGDIRIGAKDVLVLRERMAADGMQRALHLAGEHVISPPGSQFGEIANALPHIEVRTVYRSDAVNALPAIASALLGSGSPLIVLLHSPRAARVFAALADQAGCDRSIIALAAISPAALVAAGDGWRAGLAAPTPDDAALLATADALCH